MQMGVGSRMGHDPLFSLEGFYHFGLVAHDFEATLAELTNTYGLTWASVQRRSFDVAQPDGVVAADFRVTYSIEGPPHFEIVEATAGTIWDPNQAGGVHHLGYWSDDLAADVGRLTAAGYEWEASYHNPAVEGPFGFSYHTLPATGIRVELVDSARRQPFASWLAGGDFPSAMDEEGMIR